jgi:hypothetical protein
VTAVLHVIPFAVPTGGTERSVADLVASPELADIEQRVLFLRSSPSGPFDAARVVTPSMRDPFGRLAAAIRATRPHLVHTWLYPSNFVGAVVAPLTGADLVTAERNIGTELSAGRRLGEHLIAAVEIAAVANSRAVRDAAIGRVSRRGGHMRVIPPGIEDLPPAPAEPLYDVVMVGRLSP